MKVHMSRGVCEGGRVVQGVKVAVIYDDMDNPLALMHEISPGHIVYRSASEPEFIHELKTLGIDCRTDYKIVSLPRG